MLKASQLIKFISDLNPQNTPARLALFNFLKGFASPDESLTPDLINRFFVYCLDYPHWVDNKSQLGHEVQFLLNHFNSLYQQKFDYSQVQFPQNIQIIEVEHFQDLLSICENYLRSIYPRTNKLRIIPDQNRRAIALILKEDKSLEVRTFDKKCVLRAGKIEPLRTDLTLHYTPDLELAEGVLQKIEVAPYITAQFNLDAGKAQGQLIRGYVFQRFIELKNERISDQQRLLFPIKRLEQFFLDRKTDPYYLEITSLLERTTNLIQQGDSEALKWSNLTLTKAETALDNVFVGDKLLTLLIRDLRHASQAVSANSSFIRTGAQAYKDTGEEREECLKIIPIQKYDLIN